jgi:biotin carboxylase
MQLMGKKTPAKRAMGKAGLSLIPGSEGILTSADDAERVAAEVGYPVLLKAESGGGGRGMRIARSASEIRAAFEDASAEALACCRINAEDPSDEFPARARRDLPLGGPAERTPARRHPRVQRLRGPAALRQPAVQAVTRGDTREQACARMIAALESLVCEGVPTTVPVHLAILRSPDFQASRYDTRSIPGWPPT